LNRLAEVAALRKWKYFELRDRSELSAPATPAVSFYGHRLDLKRSAEALLAGFRGSVRRALHKAESSGLTVEVTLERETILEFYWLHARTRRRHGLPPQPLKFFLNIYHEIVSPGMGFVVRASLGTRPISAAVFFHFGKNAVYKFGASDERYQCFRGNNLVVWKGIRHLQDCGARTLHFGRTSLGNRGLRRFKLSWGSEEESIKYFKFHCASEKWVSRPDGVSGVHERVFARLPLVLNCFAGSIIYPHLD
jgi:hypothetical protein